ncbi:MAG: O-antigen ligase family protein [Patescibacteria group bacterium]
MTIYGLSKFGRGLISAALLTPLLVIPYTMWEFVFVRSLFFYCLAEILLLVSIIYLYKTAGYSRLKSSPLLWALLAFLAVSFASNVFSIDKSRSFFGSQTRMGGVMAQIFLFSWFWLLLFFLDDREKWKKFFKFNVFIALAASLFAVVQAFFPESAGILAGRGDVAFFGYRLMGTLGNPIFLAGYLLPNIFFAFYLVFEEQGWRKWFYLGSSVFLTATVFLTQTRGAIVSLCITGAMLSVVLLVNFFKKDKKLFLKLGIALLGLLVLFATFVFANKSLRGRLAFFLDQNDNPVSARIILWKTGLEGFLDRPVIGWGTENFSYALSEFYKPELLKYSFYETWADKPHNQYIEAMVDGGVLGIASFLGLLGASLFTLFEIYKKNKEKLLQLLPFFGIVISYSGHIFFSFDTLELRMALFSTFAYIIFLVSKGGDLEKGYWGRESIKKVSLALVFAGAVCLYLVGPKSVSASYYAGRATDFLIKNNFSASADYFSKLDKDKNPYFNNEWEYLADMILKKDALGEMPKTLAAKALPPVIKNLKKAAEANPQNFSYHYRLAQMYNLAGIFLDKKYFDDAIVYLEEAKNISPKRQVSDLLLGQVYYYKRDVAKAVEILENLIKVNSDIAEPYWYAGLLYDASGDYAKSYAFMSTAVEKGYSLKNINEEILYVTVLGRYKDFKAMAPIYERILEKDGENPQWWANLATVYLGLDRYDDARKAARQAIFLAPAFGDEGEKFLKKVDEAEAKTQ